MAQEHVEPEAGQPKVILRVRAQEFALPPVRDALVVGRQAPVGCIAMQRALALLSSLPFEAIPIPDHAVVSDVVVRQDLLRRVSREQVVQFILERIAPLMGETEVLNLDLDVTLEMETKL